MLRYKIVFYLRQKVEYGKSHPRLTTGSTGRGEPCMNFDLVVV